MVANLVQISFVGQIPIHPVIVEEQATIAGLARHLLDVRGAGESALALDEELNRRVYGLFGVSPGEVGIVEEEK